MSVRVHVRERANAHALRPGRACACPKACACACACMCMFEFVFVVACGCGCARALVRVRVHVCVCFCSCVRVGIQPTSRSLIELNMRCQVSQPTLRTPSSRFLATCIMNRPSKLSSQALRRHKADFEDIGWHSELQGSLLATKAGQDAGRALGRGSHCVTSVALALTKTDGEEHSRTMQLARSFPSPPAYVRRSPTAGGGGGPRHERRARHRRRADCKRHMKASEVRVLVRGSADSRAQHAAPRAAHGR